MKQFEWTFATHQLEMGRCFERRRQGLWRVNMAARHEEVVRINVTSNEHERGLHRGHDAGGAGVV